MSNRTTRRCRCRRLLPAVLLVCLACMAPAMAGSSRSSSTATAPTTDAGWASLEAILSDEAQNVLETMPLLEGQKAHGRVRVRLDPARNEYTLLFPRDYLAEGNGGSLEDIVSMVGNAVVEAAAPAVKLYGQKTLYDGRPLEYYFPEDFAQPSEARKPDTARSSPFKVAVFAGHGMYYHYSFKDWRAQRDPSNGILEDDITSDFSQHLSKALGELSGTRVLEPRGHDIEPHARAGNLGGGFPTAIGCNARCQTGQTYGIRFQMPPTR